MKKRNIIIACVIGGFFALGILTGMFFLNAQGIGISTGVCLISENGTCILINKNSPVVLSDLSQKKDSFSDYVTGDRLLVVHTGINESYPAQTGVYLSFRLGGGNEDEIPYEVTDSLKELGWIKKEKRAAKEIAFKYDIIKTGLPSDETSFFPAVTAINTKAELDSFITENREKYGLNDEFVKYAAGYGDDFFSLQSLVVFLISEGSGSTDHKAEKVTADDNEVCFYINRITPEAGTCDMAYYHIAFGISKEDIGEKDIRLFIDSEEMLRNNETVKIQKNYANIEISVPSDWGYEKDEGDSLSESFGINIYHKDSPGNMLSVEFLSAFGVCGTGLRTEKITLSGYSASKGIYDNNPTWDYIVFKDTPGFYVIYNNADASWWNEYGEEAMGILDTLKIAENIISEGHAREIAEKYAAATTRIEQPLFDPENGVWSFRFGENEPYTTVMVSADGRIIF